MTHPVTSPEDPRVLARRRRVVAAVSVAGVGLLGLSLATRPGSGRFYVLTSATAATWAVGGLLSGDQHLGHRITPGRRPHRPVLVPLVTGVGAFGAFYGLALVARRIPWLDEAIAHVLEFADEGATPLVLLATTANGVAEEIFFRGALYAAVGDRHAGMVSTVAYTAATLSTRNPALVLAAAVMGSLFAVQRRVTGGLQAPVITHVTWSMLMVRYLPPLFRPAQP